MFVFGGLEDTLLHRLRAHSLDIPVAIIVDDSGDLRGPTDIFLRRKPTESQVQYGTKAHFDPLRYSSYFRFCSRIEHTVIKY